MDPASRPLTDDASATADVSIVYVALISASAAMGGLLFGFDTTVIAGTVGFFETEFSLTAAMTGWVVGSVLIGCMVGAAVAGWLSDRFGRKTVLLISALFFLGSAIWCGFVHSASELVWARLVGGVGVGIASMLAPMYIAEVAPAHLRGRLVALQQLAIVVGILISFISNALILNTDLADAAKWRWMFAVEAIPAAAFFFLLLPVPESPRWLVQRGHRDRARSTIARIGGDAEADRQLQEIDAALATEAGTFAELFAPGLRRAVVVGVVLAILQQVSGINAIMYYAPKIFQTSGALAASAFAQSILIGLVNFLFTLVGMALVDRLGRKLLLVLGAIGMTLALILVGSAFSGGNSGPWLLIPILGFVAAFATSTGIVTWVLIAEIFPNRVRGRAMSVAVVALWAGCYLVSQTFPMLLESIGPAGTFFGYASMNLITIVFAWTVVPETKNRTLEQIEAYWQPR